MRLRARQGQDGAAPAAPATPPAAGGPGVGAGPRGPGGGTDLDTPSPPPDPSSDRGPRAVALHYRNRPDSRFEVAIRDLADGALVFEGAADAAAAWLAGRSFRWLPGSDGIWIAPGGRVRRSAEGA